MFLLSSSIFYFYLVRTQHVLPVRGQVLPISYKRAECLQNVCSEKKGRFSR